jgi:hypothetical protein
MQQVFPEHAGFVHFPNMGPDLLPCELPHGGLEHNFFLAERSERA